MRGRENPSSRVWPWNYHASRRYSLPPTPTKGCRRSASDVPFSKGSSHETLRSARFGGRNRRCPFGGRSRTTTARAGTAGGASAGGQVSGDSPGSYGDLPSQRPKGAGSHPQRQLGQRDQPADDEGRERSVVGDDRSARATAVGLLVHGRR